LFNFDLTDELKIKIRKLLKKDKKKVEIINKKIKEIINNDNNSIGRCETPHSKLWGIKN